MSDYSHLHQSIIPILDLDDDQRIIQIKTPRWIGYPRAQQILGRLEDLLVHPKQSRMPGMLLVGPTDNGKTRLIRQFVKNHPVDDNPGGENIIAPVFSIQAPPSPSESAFYTHILTSLFHRVPATSVDDKRTKAINVLRKIGVKVMIIDELHNILAGASVKQQQVLNMIKYLSNELDICIVGCGTGDLLRAVSVDPQVENRFTPALLPAWRMDTTFRQLLASFEQVLPLKRPSLLHGSQLATQIHALSEGTIGEVSTLINMAAEHAIRSGTEQITADLLRTCGYISPYDRKKVAAKI
ncbi:MAG TPA: transposase [Gammaproteobacteria bacterium]|nr:transposase [Gammaproteobacteria bacterium]